MHDPRLLDHFQHPRNVGELMPPAVSVEVSNPACGDTLRLSVWWNGERAEEVGYLVRGCAAAVAAGSALTEWLKGRTRTEVGLIGASVIEEALGELPAGSKHAAALCLDAVAALLRK